MKRLFDIIFSILGTILISPILVMVALLVKFTSKGPVFFKGKRVGKGGKEFRMYKFRTMVVNADRIGGHSTASDDPRLTKIGNFLKRFQLDELPQLCNIMGGQMSFVGPRPEVKTYVDMMSDEERNIILSVNPGMTDLASLWNFHEGEILKGSLDPERTYMEKIRPEKIRLQIKYVKEQSFFGDILIITKTVLKIFK